MLRRYSSSGKRADIDAVGQDGPLGDVVEAADEVDDGGLARPARPDQADHFAGPNGQVHVFQHGPGSVMESDVAELDLALAAGRYGPG